MPPVLRSHLAPRYEGGGVHLCHSVLTSRIDTGGGVRRPLVNDLELPIGDSVVGPVHERESLPFDSLW